MRHRSPAEIARDLSYSTQTVVAVMAVTGIPAWAPPWSDLHELVQRDGNLSELGRLVADECVTIVRSRLGPRAG
jgi:hypothetical protein